MIGWDEQVQVISKVPPPSIRPSFRLSMKKMGVGCYLTTLTWLFEAGVWVMVSRVCCVGKGGVEVWCCDVLVLLVVVVVLYVDYRYVLLSHFF